MVGLVILIVLAGLSVISLASGVDSREDPADPRVLIYPFGRR